MQQQLRVQVSGVQTFKFFERRHGRRFLTSGFWTLALPFFLFSHWTVMALDWSGLRFRTQAPGSESKIEECQCPPFN
jgi:hypothetical protein